MLDRGMIRELDYWKQSISRLIGITSESIRFPAMRIEMMKIMDRSSYEYFVLSHFLKRLFKNWSSISKFIRSGRKSNHYLEGQQYSRDQMESNISLLNQRDGTKTEKDNRRPFPRAGHPGGLKVIDAPPPPAKGSIIIGNSSKGSSVVNSIAPVNLSDHRRLATSNFGGLHTKFKS